MTATAETKTDKPNWREGVAVYLKPRVLIVLFMGFAAGLPLALSGSTLTVWMRESGVDLGTIGLFTLVGTPYTIKFLWAPVVDTLDVPVLTAWLGRRRGWLVLSQLLLLIAIALLAVCKPGLSPWYMVFGAALLVATASATQDILIDTFRVESLEVSEQAAGVASYVAAYRIGTLVSTAGALFIVTGFEDFGFAKHAAWSLGYLAMALFVLIGIATTLVASEPARAKVTESDLEMSRPDISRVNFDPAWLSSLLRQALDLLMKTRIGVTAVGAFWQFLTRDMAIVALIFVIFYKFCDAFAGAMTAPFIIDLGFTRNDYAAIVKGVGLAATLIGGFAGGFVARAYPLSTCLWAGAILQMTSNFVFTGLAFAGHSYWALTAAIIAENFTGAIGTVIFVAYLSALCQSPLHTATQYALLTALAAIARTFLSSGAGYAAEATGWAWFFALSALTALPSLALLWWLQLRGHFKGLGQARVVAADH